MDILVIGSGGREHALVWKLRQSKGAGRIYCAPGNAGTSNLENCENVDIAANDLEGLVRFAKEKNIGFTVVGPEEPLVLGVVDLFEENGLKAFGPKKAAARLEGSKAFAKDLMKKYGIPTAAYGLFNEFDEASAYVRSLEDGKPVVVKADGLAVGKGVSVCASKNEALSVLDEIFVGGKFGDSGRTVVIEEYMTGLEVSVLAFCDGKTIRPIVAARDHKRAYDGDEGPNTGGMGAVTGLSDFTEDIAVQCMDKIFVPTVNALQSEGIDYKGVIFFGLMLTEDGPRVIEYNARFGDPEAEAVLPMLKGDLLEIMMACADGRLDGTEFTFTEGCSACVVVTSGGYPGDYEKGFPIYGLDELEGKENTLVFHLGTKMQSGTVHTNGGRVAAVTGLGKNAAEAIGKAYEGVKKISFDGMRYRTDIGKSLLGYIYR